MDDLVALEAAIYDQSFRALDEQARILDALRARAGAVVAGANVATAFLGGLASAMRPAPPSGWTPRAGRPSPRSTTAETWTRTPVNCAGCSERFRLLASASRRRLFFGFGSSQADQAARQEEVGAGVAYTPGAAVPGHELRRDGPTEALDVVPEGVGSSGPPWRLSAVQGNSPKEATRMDLHANAALSWTGRRQLARRVVREGWTVTAAAEAAGVSVRCARKWIGRYRAGDRRLLDRSSAPRRVANRTAAERVEVIVKLRRLRMTAAEIAESLAMPLSTVSGILTRLGLGRLGRLGLEQPLRYERSRPGQA